MSSNLKTFFSKSLKLNNLKPRYLKSLKKYQEIFLLPRYLKSLNSNNLKSLNNNKAFSLIELLVVISIIGILSAIAIPSYSKYKEKAYHSVAKNRLLSMGNTIRTNQALDLETTVDELRDFTINGTPAKERPRCVRLFSETGEVHNKITENATNWMVVYGVLDKTLDCGIEKGARSCLDADGNMYYRGNFDGVSAECFKGGATSVKLN